MGFYSSQSSSAKKLPNFVTQEEFEKLFQAVIKEEKLVGIARRKRLKAYRVAMLLGFEAGLRISEIVGWKDIPELTKDRVDINSIKILGKRNKERVVPRPKRFSNKAVEMLPLKIKRRALQRYFVGLVKKVLNREVTFHGLRHGFGSRLAGQGRPLHEIQMLMGHARLDTTGIYLHANPQKAIEGAREAF